MLSKRYAEGQLDGDGALDRRRTARRNVTFCIMRALKPGINLAVRMALSSADALTRRSPAPSAHSGRYPDCGRKLKAAMGIGGVAIPYCRRHCSSASTLKVNSRRTPTPTGGNGSLQRACLPTRMRSPLRQHGTGCIRERSLSRTCPANILQGSWVIIMTFNRYQMLAISTLLFAVPVLAQTPEDPAVTACKSTGLVALQGQSSEITGLVFDPESLAISAADTKVEDVAIKTVILGEAYIERKGVAGKADRFVCLVGEKGKVLLTFFTAK